MTPNATNIQNAHALVQGIRSEIGKAIVGQETAVDQVLVAFLAAGHVLLEGVPGLGKTLLVRALAKSFLGSQTRIQFTPDLMPADVMGHAMFNPKTETFVIRRGPVFTNLLLADEINRAPAKTQSALLEVMQEQQVSIEGESQKVPAPFMVLATQNPIEQEGTYPLPEAQLDRFLMKVTIEYPSEPEERNLVRLVTAGQVGDLLNVDAVQAIAEPESILQIQQVAATLRVDEQVLDYAVRIARATRDWPGLTMGAGPRGGIALIRAARGAALMAGRDFVTPDDVKSMAMPCLRHRIMPSPEMEIEGHEPDTILKAILEKVPAPRS
jgi:MoxR-like ATPase